MTNFGIHTEMCIYSTKEDESNKSIHIRLITNKQDPEVSLQILTYCGIIVVHDLYKSNTSP